MDPRIAGAETYTGSQVGNLCQVVAWPYGILDCRLIAHLPGRDDTHEIITGGFSGRIVMLSRPPGFGRSELAVRPGALRATVEPFDAVAAGGLPGGWASATAGEGIAHWRIERDAAAVSPPQVV